MNKNTNPFSEEDLIKGIINDNPDILEWLEKTFYPEVQKQVRSRGENAELSTTIYTDIYIDIKLKAENNQYQFLNKFFHFFLAKIKGKIQNHQTKEGRREKRKREFEIETRKKNKQFNSLNPEFRTMAKEEEEYSSNGEFFTFKYLTVDSEKMKSIYTCIKKLSTDNQEFIKKRIYEGYSIVEMLDYFENLNSSEAIRVKQHRIFNNIKNCLGI